MSEVDGTKLGDWQLRLQYELRDLLKKYARGGGVGLTPAECLDAISPLAQELQDQADTDAEAAEGGISPE